MTDSAVNPQTGNIDLLGLTETEADDLYIRKNGASTTTASIPFAEGLSSAKQITSSLSTGTAPLSVASTTLNTNLNADLLDGKDTGTSGNKIPLLDGENIWGTGKQSFRGNGASGASVNLAAQVAPSSPAEGDLWHDATQEVLVGYFDGMKETYSSVLFQQTSTVTVNDSVATEQTISGSGRGTLTLIDNFLRIGYGLRLTASGVLTGDGVTTLNIKWKKGSTILTQTGAFTIPSMSAKTFTIDLLLTMRSTTVFIGQGKMIYIPTTNSAPTAVDFSTGTGGGTINTASEAFTLTATFSAGEGASSISVTNLLWELVVGTN